MKRALLLLCVGGGQDVGTLPVDGARDVTAEEHAFLELETPRDTYFVHEPIRLRLRFGVDGRFLRANMIQLFRRHLDVPVQVQAPWLRDLPGTRALEPSTPGEEGETGGARTLLSFALDDGLVEAAQVPDRVEDSRRFTVLEIERSYLPERPGELVIPAPLLRFAYATRFEEDFLGGRVAADRRDAAVYGRSLTLTILALPEEGRPPEFTGAVGDFSVRAEAEPRDPQVGGIFKLALHIQGEGNLDFLDPPRLDLLEDFHVYGKIDDKSEGRRTVTYDLAARRDDVMQVPSIAFTFFDPNPLAGYRTVRTEPIPLEVRPLPESARREPPGDDARGVVPGVNDIFEMKSVAALPPTGAPRSPSTALAAVVLLSPWLLALCLLTWLRGHARSQIDPDHARARAAAVAFRARAGQPGTDVAEAFAEFLAARLGCAPAAVIAPDLPARLEAAGVPTHLAGRAATLLDGLVAARYGGSPSAGGAAAVRALVDELEERFRAAEEAR